jgi:hypothetical protein
MYMRDKDGAVTENYDDPQPFGPLDCKTRKALDARALSCCPSGDNLTLTFDTDGPEVVVLRVDRASAGFLVAGLTMGLTDTLTELVPSLDVGRDGQVASRKS